MRAAGDLAGIRSVGRISPGREKWPLRLVLLFTAGGGLVAAYLVKLHAAIAGNPRRGLCTFTDTLSCDKVLASPYATIGGIPVALVGLLGFAFLFVLAAWRLFGAARSPRWLPGVLALTAGLGSGFEVVMTCVEVFAIDAVCPYCLTAFAFILATFGASVVAWRNARAALVRD
jgi:uncharacterized membrane protein